MIIRILASWSVRVGRKSSLASLCASRSLQLPKNFGLLRLLERATTRLAVMLFGRIFFVLQVVALLLVPSPRLQAQSSSGRSAALDLLWSMELPDDFHRQSAAPGLVILDILRSPSGRTVLLANNDNRPVLQLDPDRSGPGRPVTLNLSGRPLHVAATGEKSLWLGGIANERYSLTGGKLSEGYLTKLDWQGRVLWERTFGVGRQRSIQSLAALALHDVVVAGRDNERIWLARVSGDGKIIWERYFGLGKGASVATLGEKIIVAGFVAADGGSAYREDVAAWSFNSEGELLDQQHVRQDINRVQGYYLGRILARSFDNSVYIFSSWMAPDAAKPIDVVKLDAHSRLLWRRELTGTIQQRSDRSYISCGLNTTILRNGDPLIACSFQNRLTLFQLESATNAELITSMFLPPCAGASMPAFFPIQKANDVLWIIGSRPDDVRIASCTWLGETHLAHRN